MNLPKAPEKEKETFEIPLHLTWISEEKQVIIHFRISVLGKIRIHPNTYLRCQQTGKKARMLFHPGIPLHPEWSPILSYPQFTLIFEGLDKSCQSFDLIEGLQEKGVFCIKGINRNKEDIYRLVF